jgi:SAM-dependent methyltransferase
LGDDWLMLTRDLLAYVRATLPPPPARVLEVGAGRGELALALRDTGYEMTAVDPAAEPDGIVSQCALLDVRGAFDAALAVVSLHHIEPLQDSCSHLATLLAPGSRLVIDEIDIDRHDERAIRWWLAQRQALGLQDEEHGAPQERNAAQGHDAAHEKHAAQGHDAAQILEMLRRHVHSLDKVCVALKAHFEFGEPVRGPYLHRWELRPGLREVEVDLIAEGLLPAVGARLVATRTAT